METFTQKRPMKGGLRCLSQIKLKLFLKVCVILKIFPREMSQFSLTDSEENSNSHFLASLFQMMPTYFTVQKNIQISLIHLKR